MDSKGTGNLKSGDQPRMTESQLKSEDRGMGRISYNRQAQRGTMARRSYGRVNAR
jgi:hypothetical protein